MAHSTWKCKPGLMSGGLSLSASLIWVSSRATTRLDRIVEPIRGSKYGIHDPSHCKSAATGEHARLNMPFKLGLDHACARFCTEQMSQKTILILKECRYDYQKGLSNISAGIFTPAMAIIQKSSELCLVGLSAHAGAEPIGPSKIQGDYLTFQEWYWEQEMARGAFDDDIKAYPTAQVIAALREWVEASKPH